MPELVRKFYKREKVFSYRKNKTFLLRIACQETFLNIFSGYREKLHNLTNFTNLLCPDFTHTSASQFHSQLTNLNSSSQPDSDFADHKTRKPGIFLLICQAVE